jgi:hypothetical protein
MKTKRRMPTDVRSEDAQSEGPDCLPVQDEIWRLVGEAADTGVPVSVSKLSQELAGRFPQSGLTVSAIADAVVYASVDAGVLLEGIVPQPRRRTVSNRLPRLSFGGLRGGRSEAVHAASQV